MITTRWAYSFFLLYLCSYVFAEEKECTIHSNGKYYDLTPLRASKDYEFSTEQGHKIFLNVCKAVTSEIWELDNPANVGGVIRKDHGDFSIGQKNTTLLMSSDNEPRLVLTSGSQCTTRSGSTDNLAATIIEFKCDTTVFGAGTPRLIAQFPLDRDDELACQFHIEWKTHFACPTGERGGPWGFFAFFAILITILVMAYLVLGTLYNRYVLQLRGFDQIPQFSLQAMKYHSREGLDWFKDIMSGLYEGGQRGGWSSNVPRGWGGGSNNANGFGVGSRLAPNGGFRRPQPRSGGTPNSFSHQAQVDAGSAPPRESQGDGFVRPPRATQIDSDPSAPQRQTPPPPPAKKFESGPSAREERTFLLGDDDDEDDVIATPMTAVNPPSSDRPTDDSAPSPIEGEAQSAAQIRGRDLGDQGTIRL